MSDTGGTIYLKGLTETNTNALNMYVVCLHKHTYLFHKIVIKEKSKQS